jgi:hypothetical protein
MYEYQENDFFDKLADMILNKLNEILVENIKTNNLLQNVITEVKYLNRKEN